MMKWLLLAVVVVGVLWWLGRGRSGPGKASGDGDAGGSGASASRTTKGPKSQPEAMVACAHCGMLLPQSDALIGSQDGRPYCSEAHRRAGPRVG